MDVDDKYLFPYARVLIFIVTHVVALCSAILANALAGHLSMRLETMGYPDASMTQTAIGAKALRWAI